MEKIIEKAAELTAEFVNCDAYKEFLRLNGELSGQPEMMNKIETFYKASESLELRRARGEHISFDEERLLSNQYTEIWLNETGRDYMNTKNGLLKTLDDVFKMIEADCGV